MFQQTVGEAAGCKAYTALMGMDAHASPTLLADMGYNTDAVCYDQLANNIPAMVHFATVECWLKLVHASQGLVFIMKSSL